MSKGYVQLAAVKKKVKRRGELMGGVERIGAGCRRALTN